VGRTVLQITVGYIGLESNEAVPRPTKSAPPTASGVVGHVTPRGVAAKLLQVTGAGTY
jgi:hypothetical protein